MSLIRSGSDISSSLSTNKKPETTRQGCKVFSLLNTPHSNESESSNGSTAKASPKSGFYTTKKFICQISIRDCGY